MAEQCLISICIPAYKRTEFLKTLLDSIAIQRFRDFEVIVTDDSPDQAVGELCASYQGQFSLFYFRNQEPLGTPENWNEAIRRAKGKWIKLMHDDDWFSSEESLGKFAEAVQNHPGSLFFFSAYRNEYLDTGRSGNVFINAFRYRALRGNPVSLIAKNVIGPPSCVLFSGDLAVLFDNQLKWLVDIDFYIRYLTKTQPIYINQALICIGINESQVTKEAFRNIRIEIPEALRLLMKSGDIALNNLLVFDAWWRLMRNFKIRDEQQIYSSGYGGRIPPMVSSIIKFQRRIPVNMLRTGLLSKFFMILCYIFVCFNKGR